MQQPYRFLQTRLSGVITLARLTEPAGDALMDDELAGELRRLEDAMPAPLLVIDFSQLEFCNSSTIAALVSAQRRLQQGGGSMKLSGLSTRIHEVFARLKLTDTVFKLYPTSQEAEQAFLAEPQAARHRLSGERLEEPGSLLRVVRPLRFAGHWHEGYGDHF